MKGSGAEISPSDISALLTSPLLPPNSSAQPSVRATTEISSGPRIDQQEDAAPGRAHAVQDVGLGRAEQRGQQRRPAARCGRSARTSRGNSGRSTTSCQFFRMRTGSMPLYWPQSWNESSTVMASGISTHADEQQQRRAARQQARAQPRRCGVARRRRRSCAARRRAALMSSARQARRTASPSAGMRLAVVLADHDRRARSRVSTWKSQWLPWKIAASCTVPEIADRSARAKLTFSGRDRDGAPARSGEPASSRHRCARCRSIVAASIVGLAEEAARRTAWPAARRPRAAGRSARRGPGSSPRCGRTAPSPRPGRA